MSQTGKFAIVTLAMDKYEYALLAAVLFQTLREFMKKDFSIDYICLTKGLDENSIQLLKKVCQVREVDYIEFNVDLNQWPTLSENYVWLKKCFTKLHLVNFTEYEKVLFLDSDMQCFGDVSPLFELQTPAGCLVEGNLPEGRKDGLAITNQMLLKSMKSGYGIAGACFLIKPDKKDFTAMMQHVEQVVQKQGMYYEGGKKGFYNAGPDEQLVSWYYQFLKKTKFTNISRDYDCLPWLKEKFEKERKGVQGRKVKIVHYVSTKPFQEKEIAKAEGRKLWEDVKIWYDEVQKMKDKYKDLTGWLDIPEEDEYMTRAESDKYLKKQKTIGGKKAAAASLRSAKAQKTESQAPNYLDLLADGEISKVLCSEKDDVHVWESLKMEVKSVSDIELAIAQSKNYDLVVLDFVEKSKPLSEKIQKFNKQALINYSNGVQIKLKNPANTEDIYLFGYNVLRSVQDIKSSFVLIKVPLNCVNSPFSNDYVPVPYPFQFSVEQSESIGAYVCIIVNKISLPVEQGFLDRFPKPDFFTDKQLEMLIKSAEHRDILEQFLRNKLRKLLWQYPEEQNKVQKLELVKDLKINKPEKEFFQNLKRLANVKDELVAYAHHYGTEAAIERAKYRALQIKMLVSKGGKELVKSLIGSSMADVGCGDGLISKATADALGCKKLDMYEPFVQEDTGYKVNGIESNFLAVSFDQCDKKYDVIQIITTLHHLMNPEQIMEKVKKCLNKGGVLILREHQPRNNLDKILLDMCDKIWSYGFTNEYLYDQDVITECGQKVKRRESDGLFLYPSSFFTREELVKLIGKKPDIEMQENNWKASEFFYYMLWKF